MERPNAWKQYDEASLNELKEISQKYRVFLDNGKTERECVTEIVAAAKAAGKAVNVSADDFDDED